MFKKILAFSLAVFGVTCVRASVVPTNFTLANGLNVKTSRYVLESAKNHFKPNTGVISNPSSDVLPRTNKSKKMKLMDDVQENRQFESFIVAAGRSSVLSDSIIQFLSEHTENVIGAIRYNLTELLRNKDSDKSWLIDIIAPLQNGDDDAKKLYNELSCQISNN